MKLNYLIKIIPFLSTFTLIVILNLSNQKVNTKLKILIWNTPSLSLGSYLAISTGTGFIFSYILTTTLAKSLRSNTIKTIKYKKEINKEQPVEYTDTNYNNYNENILIEREIKDPIPTMDAKFRVIGKTERYNTNYKNDYNSKNNNLNEIEDPYIEQNQVNDPFHHDRDISSDWNDDSFKNW